MAFSKVVFAFGFIILAICTISVVNGEDEEDEEFKCLGEKITIPEKLEKITEECEKKNSGDDADDAVRCLEACEYRKWGALVNDDPKFDLKKYGELVDSMFPEGAREGIKAAAKKCFEAEKTKLSDDDDCKSHETYQNCIGEAYHENCGGDEDKSK